MNRKRMIASERAYEKDQSKIVVVPVMLRTTWITIGPYLPWINRLFTLSMLPQRKTIHTGLMSNT